MENGKVREHGERQGPRAARLFSRPVLVMSNQYRIIVFSGDNCGPEVINEALKARAMSVLAIQVMILTVLDSADF
jgi:hypothetical protein